VSRAAARTIAADFLAAAEAEPTAAQIDDVICEMANMICGAALSRLETAIRLGTPRVLPGTEADCLPVSAVRSVDIGIGTVTVQFEFESASCSRNEEFAS